MMLPANITASNENNVLSIAASSNKSLLIRFLNEQVEDGFYTLVIDYLKDGNFDLASMMVDEEVKTQCTKLYELAAFVDEEIKKPARYEIEEWIEPLFKFVYGDIEPDNVDSVISTTGIYRYSVWLLYLYQTERFTTAMCLIGERIAPLLINSYYQNMETDERSKNFNKAVMGYMDLINVVLEMNIPASVAKCDAFLNNLEVLYDYFVEDDDVGNDYKIQLSIGLFNAFIKNESYDKAFEFYGLNAEHIPVDNLNVYESFKELIRNCQSTQYANVLSRAVVTAISKQDIYNRRIDSLITEVSTFIRKVYRYVEDEPEMKRNLQILGVGAGLSDKSNVFEGLFEYNLVFHECGIKALVNQDNAGRSWEEKYEILEMLYTTLNVVFDGYSVYELSNRIEHQYVELNWIGNYVNGNPSLLKSLFSIKEKIKAFKIRKNSIIEKSKVNHEIKRMLEDRQKHLIFMTADDMISNGLDAPSKYILSNGYDAGKAEKMFTKTFSEIVLPIRYRKNAPVQKTSIFGKAASQQEEELKVLMANPLIQDMLCKSEWLWYQYSEKGKDAQSPEEVTYSVACLVKVVEVFLSRSNSAGAPVAEKPAEKPNKRVIITKTGKVIELSDESDKPKPVAAQPQGPTIVDFINNIAKSLKNTSEENVQYVKNYLTDWVDILMGNKFDKDMMLEVFEAEEVRSKTLQVIKKLSYDMLPLK